MPRELKVRVTEAYNNARENDYNFATTREWAEDMVACDADLEDESVDEIEEILKEILP